MTCTVVALGEPLEPLHDLMERAPIVIGADDLGDDRRRARGLVVGLDLVSDGSPRKARGRLRREALRWGVELQRYPAAVHLLILYRLPPEASAERVVGTAERLALRLHAEMERRARYVDVTLIDVTRCDDGERLADRLLERISGSAGGYPAAALTWSDIRDVSIAAATTAGNC